MTPDLPFIFTELDEEQLPFKDSALYSRQCIWAHEETFVIQIKDMSGGSKQMCLTQLGW